MITFPDEFTVDFTVQRLLQTRFKDVYYIGTPPGIHIENIVRFMDFNDRLKRHSNGMAIYYSGNILTIDFEEGKRYYNCEQYDIDDFNKDMQESSNFLSEGNKVIRTLHFKRISKFKYRALSSQTRSVQSTPTPSLFSRLKAVLLKWKQA